MKKVAIIGLAVLVVMLVSIVVYAQGPWGYGMGYGKGANIEEVKKFQKETLSLRDELITKRLELRQEYNKPTPDTNHIGTIRKEIIDLQTKIQEIADKHGMPGPIGCRMMGRGKMRHDGLMGTGCPNHVW